MKDIRQNEILDNQPEFVPTETDMTNRRTFFKKCGKYAIYTPPVVYLLMSAQKEAVAGSYHPHRPPRPHRRPRGRVSSSLRK